MKAFVITMTLFHAFVSVLYLSDLGKAELPAKRPNTRGLVMAGFILALSITLWGAYALMS